MWFVQCKHCGATIADKALICYKCGTATTEAKYQPVPIRPKRSGPNPMVIALAILLLLIALLYYFRVIG